MNGNNRSTRAHKLKDSCDMCSASKIRCSKAKPACGRCSKLGYPCFYSPARRMGRPHPAPQKSSHSDNGRADWQFAKKRGSMGESESESIEAEFRSSSIDPQTSCQCNTQHGQADDSQSSGIEYNDKHIQFRDLTSSLGRQTYAPPAKVYTCPELPQIQEKGHLEEVPNFNLNGWNNCGFAQSGEDALYIQTVSNVDGILDTGDMFGLSYNTAPQQGSTNYDQRIPHPGKIAHPRRREEPGDEAVFSSNYTAYNANPMGLLDDDHWQPITSVENNALPPDTFHHQSRHTSTADQIHMLSTVSEDPLPGESQADCAIVAVDLLHHLHMICMNMQRPSTNSATVESNRATIDSLVDTVSAAIKQVSTILACLCSQETDVGLLAAAVCTAILDTYGIIFRNCKISSSSFPVDELSMGVDGQEEESYSAACRVGPYEQVITIRVLGELPRVASLVTQYSRRYIATGGEESSADLLSALTRDLKSKLKFISGEATNWLTEV